MANEKRLIYADPVYEDLRKSYEELQHIREMLTNHEDIQICNGQLATYKEALLCIKNAPTVDAAEVVHGEWVKQVEDECYWYECSECGGVVPKTRYNHDWYSNYCPNCGAKMDGGNEDG